MPRFTDRLWRDLVREHGPELAQLNSAPAAHRRRVRPRLLAGTGVGVAGAATAGALILGAVSTSPAFAVTHNNDGSYSVSVERWSAIPAANQALHGLGVHAQLVAVRAGCGVHATAASSTTALVRARMLVRQARIDPTHIPAGKTLVIPAWRVGRSVRMNPPGAVSAPPACLAPPCGFAVPAPASSSTSSGNSGANSGNSGANSGNSGASSGSSGSASSGNSGAPAHVSTTQLHTVSPHFVPVPAPVRAKLGTLAKAASSACARTGAPPPGSGNSGNSGNSGDSGSSANSGNS